MIIDLILDRKDWAEDGVKNYDPARFYRWVVDYGDIGQDISAAMDYGTESDVKAALCAYVIDNDYNPAVCGYINSVKWLEPDAKESPRMVSKT